MLLSLNIQPSGRSCSSAQPSGLLGFTWTLAFPDLYSFSELPACRNILLFQTPWLPSCCYDSSSTPAPRHPSSSPQFYRHFVLVVVAPSGHGHLEVGLEVVQVGILAQDAMLLPQVHEHGQVVLALKKSASSPRSLCFFLRSTIMARSPPLEEGGQVGVLVQVAVLLSQVLEHGPGCHHVHLQQMLPVTMLYLYYELICI